MMVCTVKSIFYNTSVVYVIYILHVIYMIYYRCHASAVGCAKRLDSLHGEDHVLHLLLPVGARPCAGIRGVAHEVAQKFLAASPVV
jgi:hypothetical protein